MNVPLRHHFGAELIVFLLRAVHPVDGGWFGQLGHFFDPFDEMYIARERATGTCSFHSRPDSE